MITQQDAWRYANRMIISWQSARFVKYVLRGSTATILFALVGCSFLDRLRGMGQCDYPTFRNLRSVYVVGDTASIKVGLGDATGISVTCLGTIQATWSSSNPEVASITSTGFLTANSAGTTTLLARTEKGTRQQLIRVILPNALINLSLAGASR